MNNNFNSLNDYQKSVIQTLMVSRGYSHIVGEDNLNAIKNFLNTEKANVKLGILTFNKDEYEIVMTGYAANECMTDKRKQELSMYEIWDSQY